MIITKEIEIKVNSKDILYLKTKGYNVNKNDIITIKVSDLSLNSHRKIEVSCDYCEVHKIIKIQDYMNSLKKYDKYSCRNCRYIKYKKTMINNYGCEYPLQSDIISNKIKKSCLEKYGFETAALSNIIKNKIKATNLNKFGVENVFESEEIREKIKKTNLEKYGVEHASMSETIKEKTKKSNLIKYGVNHPMKNEYEYKKYLKRILNIKNYKETSLYYQCSYELDFLEKFNNRFEIKNGIYLEYNFKNNKKSYMPDFYLPKYNLIIEIKSNYTYNIQIEKNILKKEACLNQGYNFLFIIDKDYTEFENIINKYEKETL